MLRRAEQCCSKVEAFLDTQTVHPAVLRPHTTAFCSSISNTLSDPGGWKVLYISTMSAGHFVFFFLNPVRTTLCQKYLRPKYANIVSNGGSVVTHSRKNDGGESISMQKLGNCCNEGTQLELLWREKEEKLDMLSAQHAQRQNNANQESVICSAATNMRHIEHKTQGRRYHQFHGGVIEELFFRHTSPSNKLAGIRFSSRRSSELLSCSPTSSIAWLPLVHLPFTRRQELQHRSL